MLGAAALALVACRTASGRPSTCDDRCGPYGLAIDRALSYLRTDKSDRASLAVLDYLQRKYNLASELAFESMDSRSGSDLPWWGRLVGKDPPIDEQSLGSLKGDPGTEQLVAHALYCDRFPLPADFGERLGRYVTDGKYEGYELTHAALVLKLMADNRCLLDLRERRDLRDRVRRGMLDVLDRAGSNGGSDRYAPDVRYEALAVLQDFMGQRELDDAAFVTLLSEQQPDGGWRPDARQPSSPHSTVLAVWALLARARPEAPDIRFARH
jgi:hypothetical protein